MPDEVELHGYGFQLHASPSAKQVGRESFRGTARWIQYSLSTYVEGK
jgi:hypothetical protein